MSFIVDSVQPSNTNINLFGMSFFMFLSMQEYLWKGACELFEWPTFGEIYIEVNWCSGVRMGMKKTFMCGLDWSLITVEQVTLKVASSKVAK
jgi:hypothetical protein